MTYDDIAGTANSADFQQRLIAAAVTEAQINVGNPEPEYNVLAAEVLGDASTALGMRWLVAAAPVAGDLATDPVLLAAVQYAWPIYGATRTGDPTSSTVAAAVVDAKRRTDTGS